MKVAIFVLLGVILFPARLPAADEVAVSSAAVRMRKEPKDIVWPDPPEKPRIRFLRSIRTVYDLKGTKPGFWAKVVAFFSGADARHPICTTPFGVFVRGDLVYMTDTAENKVARLDLAKNRVDEFPGLGAPTGVAADDDGNVYVADPKLNAVVAFDAKGRQLWKADDFGKAGGELKRPTAVTVRPDGTLLVADSANSRLVVLSKEGKYVRSLCHQKEQEEGALSTPTNLWSDPDGGFIAVDPLLGRVHVFSSTGTFVSGFGELGDTAGFMARPRGIASDSDGNVYVADALFNRVQIFTRKGELELFFGGPGIAWGKFVMPAGVFIDAKDRVYVVDSGNARLEILQYIKYP